MFALIELSYNSWRALLLWLRDYSSLDSHHTRSHTALAISVASIRFTVHTNEEKKSSRERQRNKTAQQRKVTWTINVSNANFTIFLNPLVNSFWIDAVGNYFYAKLIFFQFFSDSKLHNFHIDFCIDQICDRCTLFKQSSNQISTASRSDVLGRSTPFCCRPSAAVTFCGGSAWMAVNSSYLNLRLFSIFTHFESIAERKIFTAPNGGSKIGKRQTSSAWWLYCLYFRASLGNTASKSMECYKFSLRIQSISAMFCF